MLLGLESDKSVENILKTLLSIIFVDRAVCIRGALHFRFPDFVSTKGGGSDPIPTFFKKKILL